MATAFPASGRDLAFGEDNVHSATTFYSMQNFTNAACEHSYAHFQFAVFLYCVYESHYPVQKH